jgi:1,2-dihydroxy-3-keto-5-methylthiopentene dioxygenase
MAMVTIQDEQRTITRRAEVATYLASVGIDYEHWETDVPMTAEQSAEEILTAYTPMIERLKAKGGYVTADVIDINPRTSGLDAMLQKFNIEHTHDEDEVRCVVAGRGLFHIHPQGALVVAVEVVTGDLIRVPRGTPHWFNLCGERRIRAIRLFQRHDGWTPAYTGTGADRNYEPVCFGIQYIP